jgi:magnesium chelatase family protein
VLARIRSATVVGIRALPVDVEVDLASGLPTFATVGLPQAAVQGKPGAGQRSARQFGSRLSAQALHGQPRTRRHPKSGTAFDLPIALGVLVASEQIPGEPLECCLVVGELGLEGALRPIRGALPVAVAARAAGSRTLLLPEANVAEASVVEGIEGARGRHPE